jgi:cysteinyl-tRNA synthetase
MSTKYLGVQFDIHGGGMDLKFPHHECEVAQGKALNGVEPVRYWMHSNMLTVNGQKMSKSLGNSFLPAELFSGNHPLLDQAFSPMTVRFFMLQSQYRSTLDFSNDALKAAQKGYRRLMNGLKMSRSLTYKPSDVQQDEAKVADIRNSFDAFGEAISDDLNTAVGIAELFNLLRYINMLYMGQLESAALGETVFNELIGRYSVFLNQVLGLEEEVIEAGALIPGMLELYQEFKAARQYEKVDQIRGWFKAQGLVIRDLKTQIDWAYEE